MKLAVSLLLVLCSSVHALFFGFRNVAPKTLKAGISKHQSTPTFRNTIHSKSVIGTGGIHANEGNKRVALVVLKRAVLRIKTEIDRILAIIFATITMFPSFIKMKFLKTFRRRNKQALEVTYMKKKKQEAELKRKQSLAKAKAHEQQEQLAQQQTLAIRTQLMSQRNEEQLQRGKEVSPSTENTKRILILMSDTGGGHRASAEAIERAMIEQNPGKIDVTIMDIWTDHAVPPFDKFVPQYRFLAKNPILWRIMYAYGMFFPTKLFTEIWSHLACFKRFKQAIAIANPDMVISVHPLCQLMPISIVQQLNKERSPDKLPIAFVTVVTDLGGAHMTWFDKRADFCFVPSEAVRQIACRSGLKPDKIIMHGLPIRPAFWRRQPTKSKNVVRGALFLEPDVKTVLLMGGGDGVGGMEKIAIQLAEKLSQSSKRSQIVVICGHNQKTSDNLKARTWPSNVRVVVKGFQKNIDEFMAACDLLVTKAGPGTIAEAMVQGLPMVLSSFLPGQEAGNVPYVVDGGFGVWSGQNPIHIANEVYHLFENEQRLADMSAMATRQSRAESSMLIAKDIGAIAMRKGKMPELRSTM